jgi:hypothetical protein
MRRRQRLVDDELDVLFGCDAVEECAVETSTARRPVVHTAAGFSRGSDEQVAVSLKRGASAAELAEPWDGVTSNFAQSVSKRASRKGQDATRHSAESQSVRQCAVSEAVSAAGSTFFRSLDGPGAHDRWTSGVEQTAAAEASEFGQWRAESCDSLSHERLGPALRREYLQPFLRPPKLSRGERACVSGNHCQGLLMHARSHYHGGGSGFVLREMLLPSESEAFRISRKLPPTAAMCLLCARFTVSRYCKMRNMTGTGEYTGMLCPHSVVVDVIGEYDSAGCLYAKTLTEGIDRMMPEHADNRYEYRRDAEGEYLAEVGCLSERLN